VLLDALFDRVHADVVRRLGADSMLMPVSEQKSQAIAMTEIDLFQIAESAAMCRHKAYVDDDQWYLKWLARLRLGQGSTARSVTERLTSYTSKSAEKRRLAFASILERVLADAVRAPLILYRLIPPAVEIVTAVAFSDAPAAAAARRGQTTLLPAIADCRHCLGGVLENGRLCEQCGNPVWKFDWLTIAE